jgi:hypothetical protein
LDLSPGNFSGDPEFSIWIDPEFSTDKTSLVYASLPHIIENCAFPNRDQINKNHETLTQTEKNCVFI